MKRSHKKNQQKRFYAACYKWLRLLWMGDFDLVVSLADLNNDADADSNYRTNAEVEIQTRYKLITVVGDRAQITKMGDEELDDIACHEIVHAVVAPVGELLSTVIDELPAGKRSVYYDWKKRETETVTTHITNVMQNLHKAPRGS